MLGEVRLEVLGGGDPWPANESVESETGRALSHCTFWTRRLHIGPDSNMNGLKGRSRTKAFLLKLRC